jgi:hypothetical protein
VRGTSINEEVIRLRDQILAAEASGTKKAAMLLQLTARMDSAIKRSALVPPGDVKFVDGQMRYLGVLVSVGEVQVSGLNLTGAAPSKKN